MEAQVLEDPQKTLFNLESKAIDPNWIDPKQPLLVPVDPLHVKAHRLQVLLARLDKQADRNGAQFNSSNYLAVLNEYIKCVQMINEGKTAHDLLEQGGVGEDGKSSRQAPMGDGAAVSVGPGISASNPLAG